MNIKNLFKNYWWLILAAAYIISPLDLLPISAIDDAVVTVLAVWRAYYQIKEDSIKLENSKKIVNAEKIENEDDIKEGEIVD